MFERTFSFWRRLVGGDKPPNTTEEDRRLWVRYPADLSTTIQPAAQPIETERFSATIKDISLGGAYLVVDRHLPPGQLITVELPGRDDPNKPQSVLACIVRTEEKSKGEYALGCVFSQDLDEDDLKGLGASRVRSEAADKRVWQRFSTDVRAECERVGGPATQFPGKVLDLSPTGVGLLVEENVAAGVLLTLRLLGHEDTVCRTILACVVHVSPQDSEFKLGCNFIRQLDEADIEALI